MDNDMVITENIGIEVVNSNILSYARVVERVVQTLNKRDSYYFEIINPNDYIQYIKGLGLEVPENVNKEMTRVEFAVLLTSLCDKIAHDTYSSDLIDINSIFTDLGGLSDIEKEAVKKVFVMGLMGGKNKDTFAPYDILTENQLNTVLDYLLLGYNRNKLFSVVDSCFTNEEKIEILEKYGYISNEKETTVQGTMVDIVENMAENNGIEMTLIHPIDDIDTTLKKGELVDLLTKIGEDVVYETTDLESSVLIKDVIDYFNTLWKTSGVLFNTTDNKYHYLANDSSFLSTEEWEYLNTHLDSEITLSEFLILYERVKQLEYDMQRLGYFDNWEEILRYSKNYLGFVYPMIEKNKDCFNYFLDLDEISQNSKIKPTDFARTIHECQHEEFLTIAKASFSRKKTDGLWGTWAISPRRDPDMFYYLDYTNSFWVDSIMDKELPATSVMFEHYPEYIQEDSKIKHYATGENSSSNSLGIQGLLSEFCSFAVETKVQAVSFSLGMNSATFGSLDYDSYRKMELMVKDYILQLKLENLELYNRFMSDSDVIRMINNIVKDLDYVESLYPWSMKHCTDVKLLDWEKVINK